MTCLQNRLQDSSYSQFSDSKKNVVLKVFLRRIEEFEFRALLVQSSSRRLRKLQSRSVSQILATYGQQPRPRIDNRRQKIKSQRNVILNRYHIKAAYHRETINLRQTTHTFWSSCQFLGVNSLISTIPKK